MNIRSNRDKADQLRSSNKEASGHHERIVHELEKKLAEAEGKLTTSLSLVLSQSLALALTLALALALGLPLAFFFPCVNTHTL